MKSYVISVVAAAILCVIAGNILSEKTPSGHIIKILCGLLMTITALTPVVNIGFDRVANYFDTLSSDAQQYVENGTLAAQAGSAAIIKSQAEAYILDKANAMDLQIAVEVQLDASKNQIPCGVVITGVVSPYAKAKLSSYITQTLNIPEANLTWT